MKTEIFTPLHEGSFLETILNNLQKNVDHHERKIIGAKPAILNHIFNHLVFLGTISVTTTSSSPISRMTLFTFNAKIHISSRISNTKKYHSVIINARNLAREKK